MTNKCNVDSGAVVSHITNLIMSVKAPVLSPELAEVEGLAELHTLILNLRKYIGEFSKGNFSEEIAMRGPIAGMLKSLQANMHHLIWQMQQVEAGDFSQRVDFMGEFSKTFNTMVVRLEAALNELKQKENELVCMAQELEIEVEKRGAALAALQKSEESFKYLAEHDPLTGLLNRRSFFARAEMELARSSIMDRHSCLALMDVDHFKAFNDTHGHPNGDIALRHIADIGKFSLRDADIMGRYGGEEFIFFFSKTNIQQGMNAAERIRKAINDSPVPLPGGQGVTVSASFGVVSVPPGVTTYPDFNIMEFAIGLADNALYKAKSQGRNQVCVSTFPDEVPRDAIG